ncbi:uncharacterized protein LOC129369390 [Poeciliopsis prolifica]|uniref:uncharacterized protein LOC129369390 n=1 Tax=Poeciliopsis prolifica TaxID=188132 RepID=UPI00241383D1|nr:uncharacterized protein LOC129369390 [Poeciliopsis prolifica]
MWSSPAVCMVFILFGMICNVKLVCSQARSAARQTNVTPTENNKLEEDIQKVIKEIHSLSAGNTRNFAVPFSEKPLNLNMYYSILSNLNGLFQPLMREGFFDDLPRILVCLLSERQDCGLMAELTKAVSLEMGQPLLTFFSSLKSQTCAPLTTEGETRSFFGTFLNADTVMSAFSGFQQMIINMLSNLTLSENLKKILSSLLDSLAANVLHYIVLFLETSLDYVRIALEFGIEVPSLDEQDTCKQGDLKQLIMWGLKHNVSWSFGIPLVDILLETFLPSDSGPKCQTSSSLLLQRSASQPNTYINYNVSCDHHKLAALNETLCSDVLMGFGNGSSLITFCQALSSLSSRQLELVWSNVCYIFQALFSPLITKSSDCVVGVAQPTLRRVAREASSLRQLALKMTRRSLRTRSVAMLH